MEEKILQAVITSFIKEIVSQSKDALTGLNDEAKQLLNLGLKTYLENQKEKYSYIKTLLKGLTPVYLYDIYFPLKLTNREKTINTDKITNVFKESNYITIIGDAGSGKSTLVKHLFLNSIQEKFGIPILIELRDLNKKKESIEEFIYKKIFENKLSENEKILQRLLKKGMFVFFLDGYDELKSDIKRDVINDINSFINQFGNNKYILTTRPYSDIELLPLFHNYFVKELSFDDGEIEGFIYKQLQGEKELADKIVLSIKTNKNEFLYSFLTNPLLLSLYILTFQSNAEIPNKKYIFYRRVINALFSEHDSKTKLGFVRDKVSNLNQEQFEEILKAFCFLSYFQGRFDWDFDYVNSQLRKIKKKLENFNFDNHLFVQDLKSSVSLWVDDYGTLSFAHRSLQEYFAALFISDLNPLDNKRIYEKVIDRFSKILQIQETENFLSLCEEMDTLNFKQYYYLPVLNDLRKAIKNQSEQNLVESVIKLAAKGVFIGSENRVPIPLEISENIYKGIYIHLSFAQKIVSKLNEMAMKGKFNNCNFINKSYDEVFLDVSSKRMIEKKEKFPYINLSKSIPKDFVDVCMVELLQIAKEFDNFIDKEISATESFINHSLEMDKDLVDMI